MNNAKTSTTINSLPYDETLCASEGINTYEAGITMGTTRKKGYNDPRIGKLGEDFAKDKEVENAALIEAYDKAKKGGQAEKDTYKALLVEELLVLIEARVKKHLQHTKFAEFEDLFQEAAEECLRHYERYNPHNAMTTSFFIPYIDGKLKKTSQRVLPISEHYSDTLRKLRAVAQEWGYENEYAPELGAARLSVLAELPLSTVASALEQGRIFVDSLSVIEEDEGIHPTTYTANPERMVLKIEENELLGLAYMSLSKYERYLLQKAVLEPKPVKADEVDETGKAKKKSSSSNRYMTINEITKELAKPEVYTALDLEKPPSNSTVAQDLEYAKQKCKHFPGLREYYFCYRRKPKKATAYVEYEQASFDDLAAAFADEIITI